MCYAPCADTQRASAIWLCAVRVPSGQAMDRKRKREVGDIIREIDRVLAGEQERDRQEAEEVIRVSKELHRQQLRSNWGYFVIMLQCRERERKGTIGEFIVATELSALLPSIYTTVYSPVAAEFEQKQLLSLSHGELQ